MKTNRILVCILLLLVGSFQCKENRRLHTSSNNVNVKGRATLADHGKKQTIHGHIHQKKKPSLNEEETFLRGFLNDVKELGSTNDDQKTFELSKTLHSNTFYKALDKKRIKITYHPKKEKNASKKNKHKQAIKTLTKPSTKTLNNNNGIATNKQTNSTKHSTITRKQAIEKELNFLEYLNHKSPEQKEKRPNKRENITVHNSVQSSAKLDGVKLGKRFDVPLVAKDFKHKNITVQNSVKSTAKLDGVSLGKKQTILKLNVQEPLASKRGNTSIHNSVKSNAKLDTVPLSNKQKNVLKSVTAQSVQSERDDKKIPILNKRVTVLDKTISAPLNPKKSIIPQRHPILFSKALFIRNTKRENISVHNSVQSSAKLDGVKLGKRFNVPNKPVKTSFKRANVTNHNSVKSSAKLDGLKIRRAKIPLTHFERESMKIHNSVTRLDGVALTERQDTTEVFNKRENITVHNSVQSTANLDGISLGKRQNLLKIRVEKPLAVKNGNTQIKNSVKGIAVLQIEKGNESPAAVAKVAPVIVKLTTSELNKPKATIKKSLTSSNEGPDLSGKTKAGQKQPNLQEEMEMFNKITETPFGQMEMNENMGSIVTEAKMPELKSKKKDKLIEENVVKKMKSEAKPTMKSTIGPIGATSRMIGSKKKTIQNQTQSYPYQRHTIVVRRVPVQNTTRTDYNRNMSIVDSTIIHRKSQVLSEQNRKNVRLSSSREVERLTNTGLSRSRQKRQIKLEGQNTKQIQSDIASQDKNLFSFLHHESQDEIDNQIQQHNQQKDEANHQPEYISSFKNNFPAEKNVLSTRSNSTGGGVDDDDENEGTHYYDPGTPLPITNGGGGSEEQPEERSTSTHHGDGGHGDWWKDYFPHHGTWDDPNHVYGDAQMVHHVPWNAMFPRHSYLPHEDLLNHQHHSYMGNKFHQSYERHNPKQNQGFLGDNPASAEVNFFDGSLVQSNNNHHNKHDHPYGHNTPYVAGDANREEDDTFESVHGDLCVEKRDRICSYSGSRRTHEDSHHDVKHHEHHDHTHEHIDHHHDRDHDHDHHHHYHHDDHDSDDHGDEEYHHDDEGEHQHYYDDHGYGGNHHGSYGHHDDCNDHHDDCHHEDIHHHHDHHHHNHEHVHHHHDHEHHDHEHHHHHHDHDHHHHHHDDHHHDNYGHYGGNGFHHRSSEERMVEFQRNPLDPHGVDISDHHDHDEHHHEAIIAPIPQAVEQIAVDPSNHVHYLSRDDMHDLHYDNGLFQHHDDHIERFHDDDHHHDDSHESHHDDHEDYHHNNHHEDHHDDHGDDHHDDHEDYHHNNHHEDHHDNHHDDHGDDHHSNHHEDHHEDHHDDHHEQGYMPHHNPHEYEHHELDHPVHDHVHQTTDHGSFHPSYSKHDEHDEHHHDLYDEHEHTFPAPLHQSAFIPLFSPPQRELPMFQVQHLHQDDVYHDHYHRRRANIEEEDKFQRNVKKLMKSLDIEILTERRNEKKRKI